MQDAFSRTRMLFGAAAIDSLAAAHVAVFGIGGVGGYVVEVLARSGVGALDLIDDDCVCLSNLNRQIIALHSTIGKHKVDVAEERIHDINPLCKIRKFKTFYLPEESSQFNFEDYDYVVDCIDTVTAKIDLAHRCYKLGIPIISSMGAANKIDPTAFRVADLYQTHIDPLAKIMRKKLRKLGVPNLKVVYSEEEPLTPLTEEPPTTPEGMKQPENQQSESTVPLPHPRRSIPASNAFVPATAGLIIGGEVVKDLIRIIPSRHS